MDGDRGKALLGLEDQRAPASRSSKHKRVFATELKPNDLAPSLASACTYNACISEKCMRYAHRAKRGGVEG